MSHKSINKKFSILIFISLIIILFIFLFTVELIRVEGMKEYFKDEEALVLDIYEKIIIDEYNQVLKDLNFLTSTIEVSKTNKAFQLENILQDFSSTDKNYDQIRYLDNHGYEQLRVNYTEEGASLVNNEKLQDKSQRDYYINSTLLPDQGIYISKMELNVENGQIEKPYKFVMRFVKKSNAADGYVVLNYSAKKLLEYIHEYVDNEGREVYLVNEDGSYLYLSDGKVLTWDGSESGRFSSLYPSEWDERKQEGLISDKETEFFNKSIELQAFTTFDEMHLETQKIWIYTISPEGNNVIGISTFDILKNLLIKDYYLIPIILFVSIGIGYLIGQKEYADLYVDRALKFTAELGIHNRNQDYLEGLVTYLANEFDVKYAIVDQVVNEDVLVAQTIAMYADGEIKSNIEYDLKFTPCDNVYNKTICTYTENIQALFPEDKLLVDMGAESYIGIPLFTATGQAIGLIALIDDKKLTKTRIVERVLKVVAVRASQELERRLYDKKLMDALELNENIINVTEEAIIVYDEDLKYLVWNKAACKFTDTESEDIIGNKVLEVFPFLEGNDLYDIIVNATKGESNLNNEYKYVTKTGREYWFRDHTKPLMKGGKVSGAIKTLVDISSFKENEERLKEALKNAELANNAKSRFLANMSHEIRTPMNGMLGMIDLTIMSDIGDEEKSYLMIAKKSGEALVDILNDILDLSSIEGDGIKLSSSYSNIRELVYDVIALFKPLAASKNVRINGLVDEDVPELVLIDAKRMRQVIVNLIGNAIKFTKEGYVNFSVEVLNKNDSDVTLKFVSEDTGVGIEPGNISRIFERFTQVDESSVREFGGTGLGLPISRSIIDLMGGKLECMSELDKGTIFFFDLKLKHKTENKVKIESNPHSSVLFREQKTLNVLVVDDDLVNCEVLEKFVKKESHKCSVAHSGLEAVEIFCKEYFDLILMDISMPEMDGIKAMHIIRENSTQKNEVIVAQTAFAYEDDVKKFKEEGFDGYISKPIDYQELCDLFKSIV